jgi:DHA1 family bicyclomycin/chloramphenicol resistance-like MFS transporter
MLTTSTQRALAEQYVGRRYFQLVVVLGALSAIGPLTVDTYLPALPIIRAEFGATDVQAQATLTGLLLGLGLGQLVVGPLSDAVGRRKPLLLGLIGHAVMSGLCALAPSITILAISRTLQGLAGAAVAVVAMAMVRDLFTGNRAAHLLSRLFLVLGIAPILAPVLGGALLNVTTWQGIFVVLAAAAAGLLILAWFALPETLPPTRRLPASMRASFKAYAALFTDWAYVILVVVSGLLYAVLFAYVAGSPFILQGVYGLSPQQFSLAFGGNAVGFIVATQLNPLLLRRYQPVQVLAAAVLIVFVAGAALLATAATGLGGLIGILIPLAVMVAAVGLSFPNAPAAALSRHGDTAGTAAAVLGAAQFVAGGLASPLVGAFDDGTAIPLAIIVVAAAGTAVALLIGGRRLLGSP